MEALGFPRTVIVSVKGFRGARQYTGSSGIQPSTRFLYFQLHSLTPCLSMTLPCKAAGSARSHEYH